MYLIIIITFLLLSFIVSSISDYLNTKNIKDTLPNEFIGYYDEEKYKKSQNYLKDRTKFSFVSSFLYTTLAFNLKFDNVAFAVPSSISTTVGIATFSLPELITNLTTSPDFTFVPAFIDCDI